MIWHSATPQQVLDGLKTNPYKGLTQEEANLRLRKSAKRVVPVRKEETLSHIIMAQLQSIPLVVMTLSAVVWLMVDLLMHNGQWWSALLILGLCVLGVGINVTKEAVATGALRRLRSRTKLTATVLRNGETVEVPADGLVAGDILYIQQGDYIPADGRILRCDQLRCDESTLSGEPVTIEKQADEGLSDITPLSKRSNMVFAGCTVSHGTATVVVVGVGDDTESAKMALVSEEPFKQQAHLQTQWKATTRGIGTAALVISALVFVLGVIFADGGFFNRLGSSFITCAALATAVIPESLTSTIGIILAVGVGRMARGKLMIQAMDAVETLGKVSVICTDKTGTLTSNQMTLTRIYAGGETLSVGEGVLPKEIKNLLLMSAMCCDATVDTQNGFELQSGDHTEAGIVSAATRFTRIDKQTLDSMYPRLCELPFDAERKLKTSVNMIDGKPVAVIKGAPDIILSRCKNCDQKQVEQAAEQMAKDALRVIGIAFKALSEAPSNPTMEELEYDLVFGGLLGLEDPPIPETAHAIDQAKDAGIKVIMMTGDQLATAIASARQMGLLTDSAQGVTNDEINQLTDQQLEEQIDNFTVYVRLSPENKERVVAALQKKGYVVAITGDKVEDAPVLRKADVGCAMGEDGTDVAKGAAHAVVADNNFSTILYGVSAGRGVYENIRKSILVTVGFGIGLALLMVIGLIGWRQMLLSPLQILLLNLLVSIASVLPLGLEPPASRGLLNQPPRQEDRILSKKHNRVVLVQGLLVAAATLVGFGIHHQSTVAFVIFVFAQLLCGFAARSPYSLLNFNRYRFNFCLVGGGLLVVGLMVLLLSVPALGSLFGLTALTNLQWITVIVSSIVPLVVLEGLKFIPAWNK